MNIFRLVGDLLHIFARILIVTKIIMNRSSYGISGKTQALYLMVFTARYLDVFTSFVSVYNTLVKIGYILSSTFLVVAIYRIFPCPDSTRLDTFWASPLLLSSGVLALVINHEFTVMEILWTFSIYLESVAVLPQLHLSRRTKPEPYILAYVAMMGFYRLFYIFNWNHNFYTEGFYDPIAIGGGVVQELIYLVFLVTNWQVLRQDMAMYRYLDTDHGTWDTVVERGHSEEERQAKIGHSKEEGSSKETQGAPSLPDSLTTD